MPQTLVDVSSAIVHVNHSVFSPSIYLVLFFINCKTFTNELHTTTKGQSFKYCIKLRISLGPDTVYFGTNTVSDILFWDNY